MFLLGCIAAGLRWPTVASAAVEPADYWNEARLAELVWQRSTTVLESRSTAAAADAEAMRARTLPNPVLDATWGTIPVGQTNPHNLSRPLENVPSYTAGISELIELGKRGARQRATAAESKAAHARNAAATEDQFFELLAAIGRIAAEQERIAIADELVTSSDRLLELDRVRVSKGDLAEIDLRRAEVEHLQLVADRDAALSDLDNAKADCAALIAEPCPEFASGDDAMRYLAQAREYPLPQAWSREIEQHRPDIAALDARRRGADERVKLARNRIIPDVTLRLGYTYDTFAEAGNQRNSLALGVQLPLPVADHGEADQMEALAVRDRSREGRDALVEAGRAQMTEILRRREAAIQRREQIDAAVLQSGSVEESLIGAERNGAASLADILLAQRSHRQLLLQRADLDTEVFAATLEARRIAGLCPLPSEISEDGK